MLTIRRSAQASRVSGSNWPDKRPGFDQLLIEYGLIAAGISIAITVAVNGLGTNLNNMFTSINNSLK
jgi:hypothetical protein